MGVRFGDALRENFKCADLIFVTGGLGPTTDDLTREITAELLGLELEFDPSAGREHHRAPARRAGFV